MGYAKINFKTSSFQMARGLYEIVQLVTGQVTDLEDSLITTIDTATSQLIPSANPADNWQQLFPAAGTSYSTTYREIVIRAPFNGGASGHKHLWLQTMLATSSAAPTVPAATTATTATTSVARGFYLRGVSAAASASSTSNPTFISLSTSTTFFANFTFENTLRIFWSKHHLLMYSGTNNSVYQILAGALEFDNSIGNVQPWIFTYFSGERGTYGTIAPVSQLQTPSRAGLFNLLNPQTGVTTGLFSVTENAPNTTSDHSLFSNNTTVSIVANFTKDAAGTPRIMLQPCYFHVLDQGIPYVYFNQDIGLYRAALGAGQQGDTITVGNDTYVYLPMSPSGFGAFAIKI